MTDKIATTIPLTRWRGDRGTYHLVVIADEIADTITMHARLHRLEFGRQRGFGSVKVIAHIGDTEWKSSIFPQRSSSEAIAQKTTRSSSEAVAQKTTRSSSEAVAQTTTRSSSEAVAQQKTWMLLVSKKVMRREDLAEGDPVPLELELL